MIQASLIQNLLKENADPCLTITIPTNRTSRERMLDKEILQRSEIQALHLLESAYPQNKALESMKEKLSNLVSTFDFTHALDGIGIYISPNCAVLLKFPFWVADKITLSDRFYKRELQFYNSTVIDYYVLSLSKKHVDLFKAKGEELIPVENDDFPMHYHETYEYSKPARGTSFGSGMIKEYEKDKSVLQEIRLIDFFRHADHELEKYINHSIPFVIAGGKKEIADFLHTTKHIKKIVGKVNGIYNNPSVNQLSEHAWTQVQKHYLLQQRLLLAQLPELIGNEMLAVGLEEAWRMTLEGNALELFVERNYECSAFISDDKSKLKIEKSLPAAFYSLQENAVQELIDRVIEKKGRVVFVEDAALKDMKRLVLKLRYSNHL